MSAPNDKCLYVIEDLTVPAFFFTVLPFILRDRKTPQNSAEGIYYIDATRLGLAFGKALLPFLGLSLRRLDFSLTDLKDECGQSIMMRVSNEELALLQQRILTDPLMREALKGQDKNHPCFCAYIQKETVAFTLYAQDSVWRLLYVIHVVRWYLAHSFSGEHAGVIFARPRFGKEAVQRYALAYRTRIVFSRSWKLNYKDVLLRIAGEDLLRNLYYRAIIIYQKLFIFRKHDTGANLPAPAPHPKLMVEYYGFLNIGHPECFSDLFFLNNSKFNARDILMTFNLPSDPVDAQKYAELSRNNVQCVALTPKARAVGQVPVYLGDWKLRRKMSESFLTGIQGLLSRSSRRNPVTRAWLSHHLGHFDRQVDYWCDFFRKHNIKMYLTWYNCETRNCVISHALNRVGGTSVLYQRSHEEPAWGSPEMTAAVDVAFGFSELSYEFQRASRSYIPYYAIVGYLGEYRFPFLKKTADEIRGRLRKRGAQRILAYFDENSGDDARWFPGHDVMRKGYAQVLNKVLRSPDFGLVIKPKVSGNLRTRLGKVSLLLDEALATGRCHFFERTYPPAAAALAADIAIHGHAYAITAGLESALNHVPTVLLDQEGCPSSRICRLGKGKIVFDNWDVLWQAIDDYLKIPGRGSDIGDWSQIINDFDPFRDGRALERVNSYLGWIFEGYKAHLPKETILADAAERYAGLWGQDKIKSVDTFKILCGITEKENHPNEILAGCL